MNSENGFLRITNSIVLAIKKGFVSKILCMEINNELILHLEKLARLELSTAEREELVVSLGKMVDMVEIIKGLDTQNVAPLAYFTDESIRLRDDVVGEHLPKSVTFANAPQHNADYFLVPKVIQNPKET